jgi:Na+-driven multidrug efflux pump
LTFDRNNKLLIRKMRGMLLPCILFAFAMQVGNICDDYLAGIFLGSDAVAAVRMGMNIDALTELPGFVLGSGGVALAGILLGRGQKQDARRIFSLSLFICACFGILFIVLSPLAGPISTWMTGSSNITPAVTGFVWWTMVGSMVFCIGLPLSSCAMMDGNAKVGSAYIVVSNIIKVASEYYLLSVVGGDASLVALSTVIGYGLGLFTFIFYYRSPNRMLGLTSPFVEIKENIRALREYYLPTFLKQLSIMAYAFIISIILIRLSETRSVTLLEISVNIDCIMFLVAGGIYRLVPSMSGVLFGEKDYYGLKSQMKYAIKVAVTIVIVLAICLCVFSKLFLTLFGFEASELEPIQYITVWFYALKMIPNLILGLMFSYYQPIGHKKTASLLGLHQELIFPLSFEILFILLAKNAGIDLFYGVIFGDGLAMILTIAVVFLYIKKIKKAKDIWFLDDEDDTLCDITIDCVHTSTSAVIDKILSVSKENGVSEKLANLMAITAEEMAVCIMERNDSRDQIIDLSVRIREHDVIMSMRFDGPLFDPSAYIPAEINASSLDVINSIANHIQFLRVMDFNYVTFSFGRDKASMPAKKETN